MKYRMEQRDAMRVIGVQRHFSAPQNDEHDVNIFWNEMFESGMYEKLRSLSNGQPHGVHGYMQIVDETHVDYMIGVVSDYEVIDGLSEYIVPASTWTIFEQKGSIHETKPSLWRKIFDEWLPSLEVQHAETTEIECFPHDGDRESDDFEYEIWIPIKREGNLHE